MKTYNISQDKFVEEYTKAKTLDEVSETLKMPKSTIGERARYYRGKGVKLKRMSRKKYTSEYIAILNKLCQNGGAP